MDIQNYLITLNSRGKVQVVDLLLKQLMTYFEIHRVTGQLGGKQTIQPIITVSQGKAKRTPIQQAELEYNSHMKKYLDKGYKKLSEFTNKSFSECTEPELLEFLGSHKTDANGIIKPMLAQQSDKCSPNVFEKEWYCSRKLDGTRCLLYYKDGEIYSASSGGKDYDVSSTLIRQNKVLLNWFKQNPDLILDGELYAHGIPLQRISGITRLKTWEERCEILEYWIYDIVSSEPFEERYKELMKLQELLEDDPKVKVIDHYKVSGYLKIKKLHDQFVNEGFEGLVMRNPKKEYGIGKRSSLYMIKEKNYQDSEFEIVGFEEGLRDEDMVFICKTPNGKQFQAKPIGPRELKYEYLENMQQIIGKMATVKFFNWTEDGLPSQPILKTIRDYE